jgi:hypothetical protein
MPHEVKNKRKSTAQNSGSGKQISQYRDSGEKYHHAADRENCPRDTSANGYLGHVDLRTRGCFLHIAPSDTTLSQFIESA